MPIDDPWDDSRDAADDAWLPAEARRFQRRAHLVDAAVREMAAHGYGRVSVESIAARAGLSDDAFYEQFPSKEDALVHAYDIAVAFAAPRILGAMRAAEDWQQAAVSALATYLRILDCDHAWAIVCLRETAAAGERVRRVRDALRAPLVEAFDQLPAECDVSPISAKTMLAALDAVAIDGLRHRPGQPLVSRRRELAQLVLAPFSDELDPDDLEPPPVPARRAPSRVEALVDQGEEGRMALDLLVRAAIARRDGPTLWRVIVAMQRRRSAGLTIDGELLERALDGIRDAWFFGLPVYQGKR